MLSASPLTAIVLATAVRVGDPCGGQGTIVLVQARERVMSLCDRGQQRRAFRVSMGRGGIGKQREGDNKLPVGRYRLGQPRPSKGWHLFVPIGYPTAAQRRSGYTGSAVGIHGPPRCCQGPTVTDTDWTFGCLALGTDKELDAVAEWVEARPGAMILIEDEWEGRAVGPVTLRDPR
jgi:murein L,D-transpeptidase YafK